MKQPKPLVLDANILLRAVFGVRVRELLESYEDLAAFYSPDVCFEDARKYIPNIASRRHFDAAVGFAVLDQIARIVQVVDRSLYEEYEESCSRSHFHQRPERLAGCCNSSLAQGSHLDRGSGLFRRRGCYLDQQQNRTLFAGFMKSRTSTRSAEGVCFTDGY